MSRSSRSRAAADVTPAGPRWTWRAGRALVGAVAGLVVVVVRATTDRPGGSPTSQALVLGLALLLSQTVLLRARRRGPPAPRSTRLRLGLCLAALFVAVSDLVPAVGDVQAGRTGTQGSTVGECRTTVVQRIGRDTSYRTCTLRVDGGPTARTVDTVGEVGSRVTWDAGRTRVVPPAADVVAALGVVGVLLLHAVTGLLSLAVGRRRARREQLWIGGAPGPAPRV